MMLWTSYGLWKRYQWWCSPGICFRWRKRRQIKYRVINQGGRRERKVYDCNTLDWLVITPAMRDESADEWWGTRRYLANEMDDMQPDMICYPPVSKRLPWNEMWSSFCNSDESFMGSFINDIELLRDCWLNYPYLL